MPEGGVTMLPSLWTPMGEELSTLHRNIDQLFNKGYSDLCLPGLQCQETRGLTPLMP